MLRFPRPVVWRTIHCFRQPSNVPVYAHKWHSSIKWLQDSSFFTVLHFFLAVQKLVRSRKRLCICMAFIWVKGGFNSWIIMSLRNVCCGENWHIGRPFIWCQQINVSLTDPGFFSHKEVYCRKHRAFGLGSMIGILVYIKCTTWVRHIGEGDLEIWIVSTGILLILFWDFCQNLICWPQMVFESWATWLPWQSPLLKLKGSRLSTVSCQLWQQLWFWNLTKQVLCSSL